MLQQQNKALVLTEVAYYDFCRIVVMQNSSRVFH